MSSAIQTSSALKADLPTPHAIIAWNALTLCASIDSQERLVEESRRHSLALALDEAGRQCLLAAARLSHSPAGGEVLRRIQANQPRKSGN